MFVVTYLCCHQLNSTGGYLGLARPICSLQFATSANVLVGIALRSGGASTRSTFTIIYLQNQVCWNGQHGEALLRIVDNVVIVMHQCP
jgi:hypothetical protein